MITAYASKTLRRWIVSVLAVGLAALAQISDIAFFGVRPNIVLPTLFIAALINKGWTQRIALILVASVALQFYPGFHFEDAIFMISVFIGIWLLDVLPYSNFINIIIATVVSSLIMDLLGFSLFPILTEEVYNVVIVSILFLFFSKVIGDVQEGKTK